MGVDLGDLCVRKPFRLADLAGRIVAIDAYNALYQFLASIRQPDGTPLKDSQGRVTSHLIGLFNRTANLAEAGILPVYVFDGRPHPLKLVTLRTRAALRERAKEQYEAALKAGDLATARSKAQQSMTLSTDMVDEARNLLTLLGLPFVDAPSEGEAQATHLVQRGKAHAVASQDYDPILLGAPRLLRNLTVTGRRKLPGRQAWTDIQPEELVLSDTLDQLRLSREQLIDLALLIGTDYNPGIPGVGPKTALELLRDHRSLEAVLVHAETDEGRIAKKVKAGQDGLGDFEQIRELFLHPNVAEAVDLKPGHLDEAGARAWLVEEHQFSPERVDSTLARYRASKVYRQQRTLGEF